MSPVVQRGDSPADVLPRPLDEAGAPSSSAHASSSPSMWRRVLPAMGTGARFGVGGATGLWLADVTRLVLRRGGAPWAAWFTGIGAALYVALTTAFVVGA